MAKECTEYTFGMIKPEGVKRKLAEEIEKRIYGAGLEIDEKAERKLSEKEFDIIYGHVEKRNKNMYSMLKEYMLNNDVQLLKISGENAIEKLLSVRGASDPKDALPGTIRGDFAKDQAYDNSGKKLSFNVFHATDSEEDAEKILKELFGEEDEK